MVTIASPGLSRRLLLPPKSQKGKISVVVSLVTAIPCGAAPTHYVRRNLQLNVDHAATFFHSAAKDNELDRLSLSTTPATASTRCPISEARTVTGRSCTYR
jgi:hypothetical protein